MKDERRGAPRVARVLFPSLMALGLISCGASGEATADNTDANTTSTTPFTSPRESEPQDDQLQVILKPIKTDEALKYGDQEFYNKDRSYEGKVYCGTQYATTAVVKVTRIDGEASDSQMSALDLTSSACEDRYLTEEEARDIVTSFISMTRDN